MFNGLSSESETEYTDILREPITTKYVKLEPKQWTGAQIVVQFEVLGCYVGQRITCSGKQ